MKSKLFYTITKRSYYDFVRQSIPMPPLERIQFTHFNIQQSYTLSWYNTHKQLCTCNLRGDGGYATLTLKTGEHISTFRLTESQLLSNGLASLSSSIQEFHPTPYDRLQGTQLAFYYVDPQYISSLSAAEIQVHGISHVPHVIYDGRHTKFMCGAVLHIHVCRASIQHPSQWYWRHSDHDA